MWDSSGTLPLYSLQKGCGKSGRFPYNLFKRLASPLLQGGRTASDFMIGTKNSLCLWERVGVRAPGENGDAFLIILVCNPAKG